MRLLRAMGIETANVHLGSRTRVTAVLADIRHRPGAWLRHAAKAMAQIVEREWRDYSR
jgi:hypothetical protein